MAAARKPSPQRTLMSLPKEIITGEIFAKLPAKSLVRFKCVSKTFNTLISSPEFIDIHLRHSISSDANRLLILVVPDYHHHLFSVDVDSPNSSYVVNKIPIPHCGGGAVSIKGSVNGLLCVGQSSVHVESKHFFINPSTGLYREIPSNASRRLYGYSLEVSFGFGFDDINRDYKLVRIAENVGINENELGDTLYYGREVIVYSLNANSWKLVEDIDQPYDQILGSNNGVLLKNHLLHWVFLHSDRYHIYCFDTRSDEWVIDVPLMDMFDDQKVNLSEEDGDKAIRSLDLGVLDGCLCVSPTSKLSRAIWVMKEYGVKNSWVKLFEMPVAIISHSFLRTFGSFGCRLGSKCEMLFEGQPDFDTTDFPDSELMWYNVESDNYGMTEEIRGIPSFMEAWFFKGTLAPIPNSQKIETSEYHQEITQFLDNLSMLRNN